MRSLMFARAVTRGGLGVGCVIVMTAVGVAWADGFRNPPDGAAAMGRGAARFTQGVDATTVLQNPANLMDLSNSTVQANITLAYRRHEFHSPLGVTEKTEEPWNALPSVCGVWVPESGSYAVGVGISVPYGQHTKWDDQGSFRYTAPYFNRMRSLEVKPTVSARLGRLVTVGAGVDLLWSDLEFRQFLPWSLITGDMTEPDARQDYTASGYGIGGTIGMTVQLSARQRASVTYRLPVEVDYEGDLDMSYVPSAAKRPGPLGLVTAHSGFDTQIEFPAVLGLGYGVQIGDSLRVEAFGEWVEHSSHDELDVDTGNNNVLLMASQGSTSLPQNWDDIWVYGIGADWNCAPGWVLRGGWIHVPTPVPEQTLTPSVPESDQNLFSVGVGCRKAAHTLDLAAAISLFDDRQVNDNLNSAYVGEYESKQQMVFASYAYGF